MGSTSVVVGDSGRRVDELDFTEVEDVLVGSLVVELSGAIGEIL